MKNVYTARELMEVALMCIGNATDPEEEKKPERVYWCWGCSKSVSEKDYAVHDRVGHILEEEEPQQ